jgi:hypothetical protein
LLAQLQLSLGPGKWRKRWYRDPGINLVQVDQKLGLLRKFQNLM